jgi:hypothetical protein
MKSKYKKEDPDPEPDPLLLVRIRGSGSVPKHYGSGTLGKMMTILPVSGQDTGYGTVCFAVYRTKNKQT